MVLSELRSRGSYHRDELSRGAAARAPHIVNRPLCPHEWGGRRSLPRFGIGDQGVYREPVRLGA